MDQTIKDIVSHSQAIILSDLATLNRNTNADYQEQASLKIRTLLRLIADRSEQELNDYLAEINDVDIAETVKQIFSGMNKGLGALSSPEPKVPEQKKTIQQKKEPSKPSSQQQANNRSNSLIKGMLGKFIKQQQNVRQMILPDKEQNYYFDKEKGCYVFEGEEEEVKKQIPKPPPKKNASMGPTVSAKPKNKKSELDEMMAPPKFHRKGAKKAGEAPVKPKAPTPKLTFQTFSDKICEGLSELQMKMVEYINEQFKRNQEELQRSAKEEKKEQIEEPPSTLKKKGSEIPVHMLRQFEDLSQQIKNAQEVEAQLLQKLFTHGSGTTYQNDQILSKLVIQLANLEESNTGIVRISQKFADKHHKNLKLREEISKSLEKEKKSKQGTKYQEIIHTSERSETDKKQMNVVMDQSALRESKELIYKLELEMEEKEHSIDKLHDELHYLKVQKEKLEIDLQQKISTLEIVVEKLQAEKERSFNDSYQETTVLREQCSRAEETLQRKISQFNEYIKEQTGEIEKLREDNKHLSVEKEQYLQENGNVSKQLLKMNSKIKQLQKNKNQNTIYFEETKAVMGKFSLMNKLNQALAAENQLYNAIQAKRISICTQGKEPVSEEGPPFAAKNTVLQLSESLSKLVDDYQVSLQSCRQEATYFRQKYQGTKTELGRLSQSLTAENQALQRSLNRMKSLMQTYKAAKEEYQMKVQQSETECLAMKRQIAHLKKEQTYTKQLLEQSIRSSHDNTAILRQQLEAEIRQLEQQLEQKESNQNILSKESKQFQEQLDDLLRQNRSAESKIGSLERQIKSLRDELEESDLRQHQWQTSLQLEQKKGTELEGKFEHEKMRLEGIHKNLKSKNREYQDDISRLNGEIKALKAENSEMIEVLEAANAEAESLKEDLSKQKQNQKNIKDELKEKDTTIKQLKRNCRTLEQSNNQLMQELGTIQGEMSQQRQELISYKQLYTQQTQDIQMLVQEISETKRTMENSEMEITKKTGTLMNMLQESEENCHSLMRQISQYEQLVKMMGKKLEEMQGQSSNSQEVCQLREDLISKQAEIVNLRHKVCEIEEERNSFEEVTHSMEDMMNQLQEELTSLQSNYTQNNQKMCQLIITNEELSNTLKKEKQVNVQYQQTIDCLEKQLEEINESESEQLSNMRKQLEEKNTELTDTIGILNEMEAQLENLREENKNSQQESAELMEKNNEIQMLRTEISSKQNLFQRKQQECKADLKALHDNIEELLQQLANKDSELQQQQNTITQLKDRIKQLEGQNQQLKSSVSKQVVPIIATEAPAEKSPKEEESQKSGAKDKKDKLIGNIQAMKEQINTKTQQLSELRSEVNQKTEELILMAQKLQENEKNIQDLLLRVEEQTSAAERYQTDNKILKNKLNQVQGFLAAAEIKNSELEKTLKQAQSRPENKPSENSLHKEESQHHEEQDSNHELHEMIIVQDATINELNQQIQKLKSDISSLQAKMMIKDNQLSELRRQKADLDDLYNRKSEQAEKTIQNLEKEANEMKALKDQFKKLQKSYEELERENMDLSEEKKQIIKTKDQIMNKLLEKNSKVQPTEKVHNKDKNQPEKRVQGEEIARQNSGFFGAFSSLFLTQTESEKLTKK